MSSVQYSARASSPCCQAPMKAFTTSTFSCDIAYSVSRLALKPMHWVRGQRLGGGVLPPAQGSSSHAPGLRYPCGRMASSSSASRSVVTAHGVATDSLDLPALRQQDGANRNLEGPPIMLAFTSCICSRHRAGGHVTRPVCTADLRREALR